MSAQIGIGGKGCDTVLSLTLAINILFANTVDCPGVSNIVVPAQMCPVLKLSPFLLTAAFIFLVSCNI